MADRCCREPLGPETPNLIVLLCGRGPGAAVPHGYAGSATGAMWNAMRENSECADQRNLPAMDCLVDLTGGRVDLRRARWAEGGERERRRSKVVNLRCAWLPGAKEMITKAAI
jgi:hypothetical protein